jgi:vacuolar-type H+-ATPase subunit E/Vma4
MAHTVKSFVDTLRADGVEAGRQAAEEIRREAEQQAEQTVREAEAKARQLTEEAEQQRQRTLERTRTDLELAARDTVARLRDVLSQAVNRLLTRAASSTLDDPDFLKELIREVASAYAQSDATGEQVIELNVPQPMKRKLAEWAISSFHQEHKEQKLSVELHGALATAGFEYKVAGGTVEVTPESVVQVLSQIVTPQLRELIASSQEGQAGEG